VVCDPGLFGCFDRPLISVSELSLKMVKPRPPRCLLSKRITNVPAAALLADNCTLVLSPQPPPSPKASYYVHLHRSPATLPMLLYMPLVETAARDGRRQEVLVLWDPIMVIWQLVRELCLTINLAV
jgi:hypothetical protein